MATTSVRRTEYTCEVENATPGGLLGEWSKFLTQEFVELESLTGKITSFRGRISGSDLANVRFSELEAESQAIVHTPAAAEREKAPVYKLCLQIAGSGLYAQRSREVLLSPGDITLIDTSLPYEAEFEQTFSLIIVQIPPKLLCEYVREPVDFVAHSIPSRSGIGAVLSAYIQMIARMVEVLSLNDQRLVVAHMLELVALCFGSVGSASAAPTKQDVRKRQIRNIKSFIDKNIGNHKLSIDMISTGTGMSERYIRSLFQAQSMSILKHILNTRLELCWGLLISEAHVDYSIQQIALGSGFRDYSYFTTKFRERYGVSPSFVRQQARTPGFTPTS